MLAIIFTYNGGNVLVLWEHSHLLTSQSTWAILVKGKLTSENFTSFYYMYRVPSEQVARADQIHHNYSKLTRLSSGLVSALSGMC